jgi:hypothetical protein
VAHSGELVRESVAIRGPEILPRTILGGRVIDLLCGAVCSVREQRTDGEGTDVDIAKPVTPNGPGLRDAHRQERIERSVEVADCREAYFIGSLKFPRTSFIPTLLSMLLPPVPVL